MIACLSLPVVVCALATGISLHVKGQVKDLFRLNKVLQEENYYMADFEFKMLGIAYELDKGHYRKSISLINRLHRQLETRDGLVRMPGFTGKEEELAFYRELQNPRTGAFMDDAYPFNSYHGPTENVVVHLDSLARELGRPLRLRYPLRYLEAINTPEKLVAYLDDVGTVGWIVSKFPQTPFHNARDLLSLASDDPESVFQRNGLVDFSPEWKQALLQWFYDNQDPETGLWGPKSKSGQLRKRDVNNSGSIIKAFLDRDGEDLHPSFPFRYKDALFKSVLDDLSGPVPEDDDLPGLHEWDLKTLKGLNLLMRYLWTGASTDKRERAQTLIGNYITLKFRKYYVPEDGAFSHYPGGDSATLDGVGGYSILTEIGACSSRKREKLWGRPEETMRVLPVASFDPLDRIDLRAVDWPYGINSLRFYVSMPDSDHLCSDVVAVVYPREPLVLDFVDLTQKMRHWIDTTPMTMGNWISKADMVGRLEEVRADPAPVFHGTAFPAQARKILEQTGGIVAIGYDILQVPRCVVRYESGPESNKGSALGF